MELITAPRRGPFITPEAPSGSTCWVISPRVEFLTHMRHFPRGSQTGAKQGPFRLTYEGSGWQGARGGPADGCFQSEVLSTGYQTRARQVLSACLHCCDRAPEKQKMDEAAGSLSSTDAAVSTCARFKEYSQG